MHLALRMRQHSILQQPHLDRKSNSASTKAVEAAEATGKTIIKKNQNTIIRPTAVLPRSTLLLPMRALHTAEATAPDGLSREKAREKDADAEELGEEARRRSAKRRRAVE